MIPYDMISKAQEAYEISTMNDNRFRKFVQGYDWNESINFKEDGMVFVKDGFELWCDGLDPFEMGWKPEVIKGLDFYYSF